MNPAPRGRTPGEIVLHPAALAGLAVLLVNDHVLKGVAPGWLTGKLSDVAGLVLLPFLVVATIDVLRRRRPPGTRAAAVVAGVTAAVFAAVKLSEPVRTVAAGAAGLARAPLDAVVALVTGTAAAPVAPAVIVPDATDVLAVAACAVVVLVVRRSAVERRDGVETRC